MPFLVLNSSSFAALRLCGKTISRKDAKVRKEHLNSHISFLSVSICGSKFRSFTCVCSRAKERHRRSRSGFCQASHLARRERVLHRFERKCYRHFPDMPNFLPMTQISRNGIVFKVSGKPGKIASPGISFSTCSATGRTSPDPDGLPPEQQNLPSVVRQLSGVTVSRKKTGGHAPGSVHCIRRYLAQSFSK
jgi:hypothetical protein